MYPEADSHRVVSDATLEVAKCVSNYGLVIARLVAASHLEALQFVSRLACSSNGAEIIKLSEAQHRAQAEIMREHAVGLFELGRGFLLGTTRPFRTQAITACCVIL
jgi:hypothetical protein